MLSYLLYRVGQWITLHVPLRTAYAIAKAIALFHHHGWARKDQESISGNLKVIFPEKTDSEISAIRKKMVSNFAKYLVDFFRFDKIDAAFIKNNVQIEHVEYLDRVVKEGKGVIMLSAHLGNWELGGITVSLSGYPLWAVALTHKDTRVNEFFNRQRKSKGLSVIPLGKAARSCLSLLKEGRIIALVGDRDFTEKGLVLDFFGKPMIFPEGPAALSLKTGARIIPGFLLRNPDDSFKLAIEKPIEFTPTGDTKRDVPALITVYKGIMEEYIRKYPEQWFMFRKFWV